MYLTWDEQTITDFSPENINTMYDRGFVFTRPSEGLMQQTRSVRIDLSKFELSSENRRILRKTEGLMLHVHTLPYAGYSWEIGKLAKDFYTTKFGDGTFSANKAKELLTSGRNDFNRLFAYSLNEEVLGYCIAVETPDMLHYSYPFYNLATTPKDMGLGMMTRAIVWAKENGKRYIYLGSAQRESDTYKFQFSGLEVFEKTEWSKNNRKHINMSRSEFKTHHADMAQQEENLIIEKILTSAVETLGLSTRDITITHGRKELTVTFENAEPVRAYTFVKNKQGEDQTKPNETTLLYVAIRKIIQQETDRLGLPIVYTLTTTNPQMMLWANTKGRELFDWGDEKNTQFETRERLTCTKTFYPEPKKE